MNEVKVLIVGQDPYPTPGNGDGAFVLGAAGYASAEIAHQYLPGSDFREDIESRLGFYCRQTWNILNGIIDKSFFVHKFVHQEEAIHRLTGDHPRKFVRLVGPKTLEQRRILDSILRPSI